jgi:acetyl esterase/lipase
VSPWVSFTQERASWKSNHKKDALDPATVRIWSDNFMGKTPNDNWSQPAEAPAEWWIGLKVDNIAITAGGNEVLRDDIRALAENIKVSRTRQAQAQRLLSGFELTSGTSGP